MLGEPIGLLTLIMKKKKGRRSMSKRLYKAGFPFIRMDVFINNRNFSTSFKYGKR